MNGYDESAGAGEKRPGMPESVQNYLSGKLTVALLDELTRRGIDRGLIGDCFMTIGIAVVIGERGVDTAVADLRKVTGEIVDNRDKFFTAEGTALQ